MITTTLNRIRAHGPCAEGWQKLLAGLNKTAADDEPLPFARILAISGLDDALWCCRAEPQYAREWRLFAVWCARQVQHLMTDPRSVAALDVAERYAQGQATDQELAAAGAAAMAAAARAAEEEEAAGAAAMAAAAARAAAGAAAAAMAAAALWLAAAAAGAAAMAAGAAAMAAAARAAAGAAAEEAAAEEEAAAALWLAGAAATREKQAAKFLRVVTETEARP